MGRRRSNISANSTSDDLVFVNSKTYGPHTRARRGSKSKAEVNEAFKSSNSDLVNGLVPAQLVKNTIDFYSHDIKVGQLWQRLLSLFKKQCKENVAWNLTAVKGWELNSDYPLRRLIPRACRFKTRIEADRVHVTINQGLMPNFKRKYIDGYQMTVIGMFFDFDQAEVMCGSASSEVLPLHHGSQLELEFPAGNAGMHYLVCLRLDGCEKGKVQSDSSVKAMQIIQTGIMV